MDPEQIIETIVCMGMSMPIFTTCLALFVVLSLVFVLAMACIKPVSSGRTTIKAATWVARKGFFVITRHPVLALIFAILIGIGLPTYLASQIHCPDWPDDAGQRRKQGSELGEHIQFLELQRLHYLDYQGRRKDYIDPEIFADLRVSSRSARLLP